MPLMGKTTLKRWFTNRSKELSGGVANGQPKTVLLFCDEFTNYNDVEVGQKAVQLFERLGYTVIIPEHGESGRAALSKGMLTYAKTLAEKNIRLLKDVVSARNAPGWVRTIGYSDLPR